ncbi:MAG: hypothetical protein IKH92_08275 [Clostridiales bacterium]|nr:hypothetical protein [Clostridiales bacterium]
MGKSKCTTKVAALLMAMVIVFIPFRSAFAAGRSYARNLCVDDGFKAPTGHTAVKEYTNHNGTYYVRQGDEYAFLEGEIVNVSSSFTLTLVVRDNDAGCNIRKVTERITVPSGRTNLYLYELCSLATYYGGKSNYCSQELTDALYLKKLPVGNYSFAFYVNDTSSGTVTYVRVYSREAESLVYSAFYNFNLSKAGQDFDVTMYKLSTHQMSGTDFLWNLYVKNQAKGIFRSSSSREIVRLVCKVAYGRYPNAVEEGLLLKYCSIMGEPLTVKRIIFSGQCQNHLMDLGIKP